LQWPCGAVQTPRPPPALCTSSLDFTSQLPASLHGWPRVRCVVLVCAGGGPGAGRLSLTRGGPAPKVINLPSMKSSEGSGDGSERGLHEASKPTAGLATGGGGSIGALASGGVTASGKSGAPLSRGMSWVEAAAPRSAAPAPVMEPVESSHSHGHSDSRSFGGTGGGAGIGGTTSNSMVPPPLPDDFNWADEVLEDEARGSQASSAAWSRPQCVPCCPVCLPVPCACAVCLRSLVRSLTSLTGARPCLGVRFLCGVERQQPFFVARRQSVPAAVPTSVGRQDTKRDVDVVRVCPPFCIFVLDSNWRVGRGWVALLGPLKGPLGVRPCVSLLFPSLHSPVTCDVQVHAASAPGRGAAWRGGDAGDAHAHGTAGSRLNPHGPSDSHRVGGPSALGLHAHSGPGGAARPTAPPAPSRAYSERLAAYVELRGADPARTRACLKEKEERGPRTRGVLFQMRDGKVCMA
jgi:hypothetical protein